MKYHIKIAYRTPLLEKISGYMQDIFPDWKENDKHLEVCRTYEFETPIPLSDEQKEKIMALKEDWMNEIVIEEVS